MKTYELTVDGFKVGLVELTKEEVKSLLCDSGIVIKEVTTNNINK